MNQVASMASAPHADVLAIACKTGEPGKLEQGQLFEGSFCPSTRSKKQAKSTFLSSPKSLKEFSATGRKNYDWSSQETDDLTKLATVGRWKATKSLRDVVLNVKNLDWFEVPSCQTIGGLYQHAESGEYCVKPLGCDKRGWCPYCAIRYGLSQGSKAFNQIETLYQRFGFTPQVKLFEPTFTLPNEISMYLGSLIWQDDKKELQRLLSHLTDLVYKTLTGFFGGGLGMIANIHWWHSSDPMGLQAIETYGHPFHFHFHVMLLNARVFGDQFQELRKQGVLERKQLEVLKSLWFKALSESKEFTDFVIPNDMVVDWGFAMSWEQVKHSCEYDFRHPLSDLTDFHARAPLETSDELGCFIGYSEFMQPINTTRKKGFLSPHGMKKLGIEKDSSPSPWSRIQSVTVFFQQVKSMGMLCKFYWSLTDRYEVQFVPFGGFHWFQTSGDKFLINSG